MEIQSLKDIKALLFSLVGAIASAIIMFLAISIFVCALAEPVTISFKCGNTEFDSVQYEPHAPVSLSVSSERGTYMQVPMENKIIVVFYNLDTAKVIKMKKDSQGKLHALFYSNVDYANADRPYREYKCFVGEAL
jgi:hypothetical protein